MSRVRRISSERSWVQNPSGAVSNVGLVYHTLPKVSRDASSMSEGGDYRQTDRQTDRETERQTDRQTKGHCSFI